MALLINDTQKVLNNQKSIIPGKTNIDQFKKNYEDMNMIRIKQSLNCWAGIIAIYLIIDVCFLSSIPLNKNDDDENNNNSSHLHNSH